MNNREKHIVFVITRSEEGGAQTHLLSLVKSMMGKYKITLITGEFGFLEQRTRKLGIDVHVLPVLKRQVSIIGDIKTYFQLKNQLKAIQPDLVHFHSTKAGIIGRLVTKNRYKTVFTAHGWVFAEGAPKYRVLIGSSIERFVAKWTDIIITVSKADFDRANQFNIAPKSKIRQIYNGIEISADIHKKENTKVLPRLVMVARLVEQKDHLTLLNALKLVDLPYQLTIVGDGPKRPEIVEYIQENNLSESVDLLGNSNQVGKILNESDMFILSTNWEGFPISILEAMVNKLPVIASDVGGVKEQVIHNQTGYLIEPNNPEILAQYITQLLQDRKKMREFGDNGYQLVKEKFSLQEMIEKTTTVYGELFTNR